MGETDPMWYFDHGHRWRFPAITHGRAAAGVKLFPMACLALFAIGLAGLGCSDSKKVADPGVEQPSGDDPRRDEAGSDGDQKSKKSVVEPRRAMPNADVARTQARIDASSQRVEEARGRLQQVADMNRDQSDSAQEMLQAIDPIDRGWEWQFLMNRTAHQAKTVLQGHDSHVVAVAFDPSGSQFASGGLDGRVQWWSLAKRDSIDSLQFEQAPRAKQYFGVEFDATGERLVVVSLERGLEVIDLATRQARQLWPLPTEPARRTRIARHPDGSSVAVACADQAVYLVPIPRKDQLAPSGSAAVPSLAGHDAAVTSMTFSGDGKQLLVGAANGQAYLWDLSTREVIQTFRAEADAITGLAFHPRAALIIATSRDGGLRVWDRQTAAELASVRCDQGLLDLVMTPNGTRLFTGGADGAIRVWDLILHGGQVVENTSQPAALIGVSLHEIVKLGAHTAECHALALTRDGTCLVSAGGDFSVRIWDAAPDSRRVMPDGLPRHYVCYRTAATNASSSEKMVIDGRLDEAAWKQAPWSDHFVDIEGLLRLPPRLRTRVKMLWDDRALYIAAELEEPDVWGTLKRHDSVIFYDNDFEIFLDPDGDNHRYGEFEMNALNTGWDLFLPKPYKDGGGANDAWEIRGIETAVFVDGSLNDPRDEDRGWFLEVAIPWSALGQLVEGSAPSLPPQADDVWRINFSRVEWQHEIVDGEYRKVLGRAEDNWVWSPQGVINMHRPETWGYLTFSGLAVAQSEQQDKGVAAKFPDPAWHAKLMLQRVHDAQSDFRNRAGRWARNVEELQLAGLTHESLVEPLVLQIIDTGYEVRATVRTAGDRSEIWCIDAESRIYRAADARSE